MSTFVMGGIGPMDVSNVGYLLLFFLISFFVMCICAGVALIKRGNSNQTMEDLETDVEYPVGAESALPDSLCLRVVEARESRK